MQAGPERLRKAAPQGTPRFTDSRWRACAPARHAIANARKENHAVPELRTRPGHAERAGGNHDTRIGVGLGNGNGESASAMGVQHGIGMRAALTTGGAFASSETPASAGFGIGL